MTKVWVSILVCALLAVTAEAQRKTLRLFGFVPPKAHVDIGSFSRDDGVVELTLNKNTRSMNFKMTLEPHWGKDPRGKQRAKRSGFKRHFVLAARGEKRRVDLNRLKSPTRNVLMTILSP